jgi:hypothetical protein
VKEESKQPTFSTRLGLGVIFAVHAGLILSGVKPLENLGYVLAIFIVTVRAIGVLGIIVTPGDELRESLDKVFWHWTMLFPTIAMAMKGWFAMAVVYGVAEFIFMILANHCKKSMNGGGK